MSGGEALPITNICCLGAGYVGGPTMAVIAMMCPEINVNVVDINIKKIDEWNSEDLNNLPVYEPGLSEIIKQCRNRNLFFSNNIKDSIEKSEIIFMAVNTPTKTYGDGKGMAADLTFIEKSSREILKYSNSDKIVVEKSTLPVRTAEKIKSILSSSDKKINFEVLSNPEFLAEGTAINDLYKSDRVLIGGDATASGQLAVNTLVNLYARWIPIDKILTTNVWSSELSKLVSNAFLAQRISSINSVSAICEKTGADISEVSKAVGMDKRIGKYFLNSSVGFGGSCFKKDILNLVYIAQYYGLTEVANYWLQVVKINNYQTKRFSKKILKSLYDTVNGKTLSILGWAFKKDTNDSRESASIYLTIDLLNEGAYVKIYDPKVDTNRIVSDISNRLKDIGKLEKEINDILKNQVFIVNDINNSFNESHAVIILTEWDEFNIIDWEFVFSVMEKPSFVFDGRRIIKKNILEKIGFNVYVIGS